MITLGVSDFKKAYSFYKNGLGFKPHNYKEGDNFVTFEMQGTWLALFPKDKLAKDANMSELGTGFPGFTLAHNVRSEKEVDNVFNFALSAGARSIKKPQKVFWGGYSGYFADPDGYLWEVAFNPFTDLT